MLTLRAGQPVPVAELIDAVRDDQPPLTNLGWHAAALGDAHRALDDLRAAR